jgi:signal transduction histidine kinase
MADQTIATHIQSDLNEQRESYLKVLLAVCTLLLGATTPALQNYRLFSILFFSVIIITFLLSYSGRYALANFAFLYGFMAAIGVQLAVMPLNPFAYFFLLIPIILSNLFLEDNLLKGLAPFAIVLMIAIPTSRVGITTTFSIAAVPILVCIVLAVTMSLSTRNIIKIVQWAADSQQKDARRAEAFYEQREQLKTTLLQLKHANAKLESLNVDLEIAQKWAEQASQAKTAFISNMSHELRTPLNVVIGYSSSMLQTPAMYDNLCLPDVYRRDIQLIQDNGVYLVSLINDILDLSKIESNKLELHYARINVMEILQGVVATSIGLVKDKPVQITLDASAQLPCLWADPRRLRQILLNLMSNAAKFTKFGTITLHASVEGERLNISVTDTGIGIPEKALAHIFDRYEQATHDTDKHFGGTGLGLDISKHLSMMHDGDLTVKSREGEGSTFTLSLPIIHPPLEADEIPVDTNAVVFEQFEQIDLEELLVVLLIESEISLRNIMQHALQEKEFVVINADSESDIIEFALNVMPNMVVLDADDGWKTWDTLKAHQETASIPMVVYAQRNERNETNFLSKPTTPAELIDLISRVKR